MAENITEIQANKEENKTLISSKIKKVGLEQIEMAIAKAIGEQIGEHLKCDIKDINYDKLRINLEINRIVKVKIELPPENEI